MIAIAGLIHADQFIDNPSQGTTSIPVDVSPAPPANVTTAVQTALDGRKVVAVQWTDTNPPGSMATFNVDRAQTPGGEGTTPHATGVTADHYTDLGAAPDQVYYYQVTAVAGGLESRTSRWGSRSTPQPSSTRRDSRSRGPPGSREAASGRPLARRDSRCDRLQVSRSEMMLIVVLGKEANRSGSESL
jgi:hypothetical protein